MATNPRIRQAHPVRHDRVECLRVRHMPREMYEDIMELERELATRDPFDLLASSSRRWEMAS